MSPLGRYLISTLVGLRINRHHLVACLDGRDDLVARGVELRIANVATERALTQQLYNTPPLFHVSAATLADRLPAIVRHDAFFRPLHKRLAQEAMTAFEWLSKDRLVQRTSFADGTQLIANFADDPRSFGHHALPRRSVTAIIGGRAAHMFKA